MVPLDLTARRFASPLTRSLELLPGLCRSLVEAVAAAVAGGATIVQLREKKASGGEFFASAAAALAVCRAAGVALLINDRVDVALAVRGRGLAIGLSRQE